MSHDIESLLQAALELQLRGQLAAAELIYRDVLSGDPGCFPALHRLGVVAMQTGREREGVSLLRKAVVSEPAAYMAHASLATALLETAQYEDALESIERARCLRPESSSVLVTHGNVLLKLARHDEALHAFDASLRHKTDFGDALIGRGIALLGLKRPGEAKQVLERAVAVQPRSPVGHCNLAFALLDLNDPEQARACFQRALEMNPDLVEALKGMGNAMLVLKRPEDALSAYQQAAQRDPNDPTLLCCMGVALHELGHSVQATDCYQRALALRPEHPETLERLGLASLVNGKFAESARIFDRLLKADSHHGYAAGNLLHARSLDCDWREHAELAELIDEGIRRARSVSVPFTLLAVSGSAAIQHQCARHYSTEHTLGIQPKVTVSRRARRDKIRLAYVSPDFGNHPVSHLMIEHFERHDRTRFEIIGISLRAASSSAFGQRVVAAFDRFIDVSRNSDNEAAAIIRANEIDIAVDLAGFTAGERPGIFARRAAPVQVNFLGYPGTMGANFMDYIIADRHLVPEGEQVHYSEHVVLLPDCYQPNSLRPEYADRIPNRVDVNLPEDAFVFCCFNNSFKITPAVFSVWMDLLRGHPSSVLWLSARSAAVMENLRREALLRNVDPARLIFAPQVTDLRDHLARSTLADLFLDTSPFNAHATASDALWAGVPVLTCTGSTFAGRVATSLLHAIGLPELAVRSLDEYAQLASELVENRDRLSALRARLSRNRTRAPLFDSARYRRHLERAFETMQKSALTGCEPGSFEVAPESPVPPCIGPADARIDTAAAISA